MGTVIKTIDRDYNKGAKSWYDSTFKLLFPIEGNNVAFYSSYLRNRAFYKTGVDLSGTLIKFKVALANNPGTELTQTQLFSAYDYTHKIKLDVFFQREGSSNNNILVKVIYATQDNTTTFDYTIVSSAAIENAYKVLLIDIDTSTLTASGTYYQRYTTTQPVTSFTMNKTSSAGKTFTNTTNIIAVGTDSENIQIELSDYGRFFAMYVEIDEGPIFSTRIQPSSAKGAYIDYSSGTVMNYIGADGTNSKVGVPISTCNVHN